MTDLFVSIDKRLQDQKTKPAKRRMPHLCERLSLQLPRALPATDYPKYEPVNLYRLRLTKMRIKSSANKATRADKRSLIRQILNDAYSTPFGGEAANKPDETILPGTILEIPEVPGDIYEYDISGYAILSVAVNKALEEYETKETEKVAREYGMVHPDAEALTTDYTGCIADDRFELVDDVKA